MGRGIWGVWCVVCGGDFVLPEGDDWTDLVGIVREDLPSLRGTCVVVCWKWAEQEERKDKKLGLECKIIN